MTVKRHLIFIVMSVMGASTFISKAGEVDTPVPADTLWLDELNVVAVKQQQDLFTQPVSATVLGADLIQQMGISDIKQVSDVVPNFFIPDYGSRITSSIYVRGIGSRIDQPAVGLNIDNLPILNKDAYDLEIADIADMEILRGPQSALYGRNAMTGLINIRTLSPMVWQGFRAMAQYGSGESVKATAGWYRKFSPLSALAVTGGVTSSRGRFVNDYNGCYIDPERSVQTRLRYEWRPLSNLSVSNVLAASHLRQGGYPYMLKDTDRVSVNDTCSYRRTLINDALTLHWRGDEINASAVVGYQYIDDCLRLDQDFSEIPYFTLTQAKQEYDLTLDVPVRGRISLPTLGGGGEYGWLAGLFLFYRHGEMQAPVGFKKYGIDNLIVANRNGVNRYRPISWDSDAFTLSSDFTMPDFGVALYHESQLDLDRWHFKAGLRLDYENPQLRYRSYCNTGYTIYDNPTGTLPMPEGLTPLHHIPLDIDDRGTISRHYLTILPKISVLYDIDSDLLHGNLYALTGKGYKAGGYNTQMFSDVLQQRLMGIMGFGTAYDVDEVVGYRPEYSWTTELGAHLSAPDGRWHGDATLFWIECRDQQLTVFPPGNITGRMMTNAGKTRSLGAELSMRYSPVADLWLTGSYGYTDARFRDYHDGKADYSGKHLPYAPEHTLYLQGLYTWQPQCFGANSLEFDINLRGVGGIYWNEANTLRQPFYTLLGGSITWQTPHWSLQLWGRNLTDTSFDTFYFMSMGREFLQRGTPLTAGLTLRLNL